jgi:hypothetical protein
MRATDVAGFSKSQARIAAEENPVLSAFRGHLVTRVE